MNVDSEGKPLRLWDWVELHAMHPLRREGGRFGTVVETGEGWVRVRMDRATVLRPVRLRGVDVRVVPTERIAGARRA